MDYTIQRGKTIILKSATRIRQIYIENIVYISCDSYLVSINLFDQQKPEIFSKSLKEIQKELSVFYFLKINRNQLINMRYFKSFYKNGARKVLMSNNVELEVSRRQWSEIKNNFLA